eukprot:1286341-Pyramimonas_sp.AAC.1
MLAAGDGPPRAPATERSRAEAASFMSCAAGPGGAGGLRVSTVSPSPGRWPRPDCGFMRPQR